MYVQYLYTSVEMLLHCYMKSKKNSFNFWSKGLACVSKGNFVVLSKGYCPAPWAIGQQRYWALSSRRLTVCWNKAAAEWKIDKMQNILLKWWLVMTCFSHFHWCIKCLPWKHSVLSGASSHLGKAKSKTLFGRRIMIISFSVIQNCGRSWYVRM